MDMDMDMGMGMDMEMGMDMDICGQIARPKFEARCRLTSGYSDTAWERT